MNKFRNTFIGFRRMLAALLTCAVCLTLCGAANATGVTETDVRYAIDFAYLREVVPQSVAWLYQPGTSINQPVMLSDDMSYYLRRQFNGHTGVSGAIFMLGTEAPDFSAPIITMYGRNCLDNTLFGSLSEYRDDAYYRQHSTFYLLTPQGDYRLDVFAGVHSKSGDDSVWRVSQNTTAAIYERDLARILENSYIQADPASLPTKDDAWAVMTTEWYNGSGARFTLYARMRPITYQTDRVAYVNQLDMDTRETQNGRVTVNGVNSWMLYAQNDPLFYKLKFEVQSSARRRPFSDGGCGPTAVAMAIANLVDESELSTIAQYASSPFGYRFCTCSVNDYWCSGRHIPYRLTTTEGYLRYFPLVIASFATGNNIWGVRGRTSRFGTNMNYLSKLCEVYGIAMEQTSSFSEATAFLQKDEKTIAVACTLGKNSPFTKTSHFVVLADVKDGYLYVLDPLRRESYASVDTNDYLEMVAPGLVRVKLENAAHCNFYPIYLLERAPATQPEATDAPTQTVETVAQTSPEATDATTQPAEDVPTPQTTNAPR